MRTLVLTITASLTLAVSSTAQAFCGFYVARADTSLYNQASQVVLVRDGDRTVITMANDFQGDVEDFAVVIPVPTFIEREQINVADNALIEHLDAYTAPRLVEYHDPDPCSIYEREEMALKSSMPRGAVADAAFESGRWFWAGTNKIHQAFSHPKFASWLACNPSTRPFRRLLRANGLSPIG